MDPHFTAPDPEGKCCVEGCDNDAAEMWYPDHCALREGGVQPDWHGLCLEHDLELNLLVTKMFFGDKYNSLLEAYAAKRRIAQTLVRKCKERGIEVFQL